MPPSLHNIHQDSLADTSPPSSSTMDNGNVNGEYYHSMPSSSSRQYSSTANSHSPSSTFSSASTSTSRPSSRRSSYNRQAAAAVFGDYHSAYSKHGPLSPSMSSTAGDEGDVPPPRSSSSSNLSSTHSNGAAGSSASERRRNYRRSISASADSSPRQSISFSPLSRIHDIPQEYSSSSNTASAPNTPGHARFASSNQQRQPQSATMQASLSDSALQLSSSSSTSSPSSATPEDSDLEESKKTLSSPLLQKHKPSWGEIPTPTSLNGSTSFSFGQNPSSSSVTGNAQEHYDGRTTMLSEVGRETSWGSSSSTPKAEKSDPTAPVTTAEVTIANTNANANASPTALRVQELQNEFVDAQPSLTKTNGGEPFFVLQCRHATFYR